jgi:hypothetical protein
VQVEYLRPTTPSVMSRPTIRDTLPGAVMVLLSPSAILRAASDPTILSSAPLLNLDDTFDPSQITPSCRLR